MDGTLDYTKGKRMFQIGAEKKMKRQEKNQGRWDRNQKRRPLSRGDPPGEKGPEGPGKPKRWKFEERGGLIENSCPQKTIVLGKKKKRRIVTGGGWLVVTLADVRGGNKSPFSEESKVRKDFGGGRKTGKKKCGPHLGRGPSPWLKKVAISEENGGGFQGRSKEVYI